jgi:hypothetical protein
MKARDLNDAGYKAHLEGKKYGMKKPYLMDKG